MTTMASTHSVTSYFMLGNDGGLPITEVTLKCHEGNDQSVVKTGTSASFDHPNCMAAELTGLTPGTTYTCQLFAENDVGESSGSDSFEVATLASSEL